MFAYRLPAHPCSRGENQRDTNKACRTTGSSLLTRGKQRAGAVAVAALGFIPANAGKTGLPGGVSKKTGPIPAHAGKTNSLGCQSVPLAAHPRSRGENKLGAGST